jgi:hypothetical protein
LILLVSVLAFTVPWSVRNTQLHGKFTFVENAMGYSLYMGYHPDTEGRFEFGPSVDLMPYLDDGERNSIGMEKAIGFIRQAPERVPTLMLRKLGYFFGLERRALTYFYSNDFLGYLPQPYISTLFILFTLPFVLLVLSATLALAGMVWHKAHILVAAFILSYLVPHLLILAEPRFHLTIVPILAVFAAYCWVERRQVWAAMVIHGSRWKLVVALVVVGFLLFNWGFELWSDSEKLSLLFGPEGNKTYFSY